MSQRSGGNSQAKISGAWNLLIKCLLMPITMLSASCKRHAGRPTKERSEPNRIRTAVASLAENSFNQDWVWMSTRFTRGGDQLLELGLIIHSG